MGRDISLVVLMRLPHDLLEVVVNVRIVEALSAVLNGIGSCVKQQGLSWQIRSVDSEEFGKIIRRGTPDGAITVISSDEQQLIAAVKRIGLPTVNLFHDLEPEVPSVLSDDEAIGRHAAKDLLRLGFRSMSFLGLAVRWSEARQRGFVQALQETSYGATPELSPPLVLHPRTINSV